MIVDPDRVARVIAEIAEAEIAPRFGKLEKGDIDTKTGPGDFVTEADRAAEAALQRALRDLYPGAVFVGEESVAENPQLLFSLDDRGAFWIVDPLDGTRNFVQGRPEFGTIVALVDKGEIRAGWIYAIPDRTMALGAKGEGAFWAGERLGAVDAAAVDEVCGYRAIGNLEEPWKSDLIPRLRAAYATEPAACSAYVYIRLVRGLKAFALYSRVHPWDHAAGVMLLREIGGRAEYLDDASPYAPLPAQGRPLLVAGSDAIWREVRAELTGQAQSS